MSLLRNRTIRHSTGFKSLHNRASTFYLININPLCRIVELHKTSNIPRLLSVNHGSVLFKLLIVSLSCCRLEHMNGLWIVSMSFTLRSHLMTAHGIQGLIRLKSQWIKGFRVLSVCVSCNIFNGNSTDTRHCSLEVFVDNALMDTYCFKNTAALVGLNG